MLLLTESAVKKNLESLPRSCCGAEANRKKGVEAKLEFYLGKGIREAWVVHSQERPVAVGQENGRGALRFRCCRGIAAIAVSSRSAAGQAAAARS
jgi:hypothetical protein